MKLGCEAGRDHFLESSSIYSQNQLFECVQSKPTSLHARTAFSFNRHGNVFLLSLPQSNNPTSIFHIMNSIFARTKKPVASALSPLFSPVPSHPYPVISLETKPGKGKKKGRRNVEKLLSLERAPNRQTDCLTLLGAIGEEGGMRKG